MTDQATHSVSMEATDSLEGPASHLLNLPEDVLLVICDNLQDANCHPLITVARFETHFRTGAFVGGLSEHPLIDISKTCTALRQLCLPRLFFSIYLYNRDLDNSLQHVFVHTRRVFVPMATTAEHLSAFLKLAPNVGEAYFRQHVPLLSPFLQSNSHEAIVVANPRTFQQSFPLPTTCTPLRVFRMCFPSRLVKLIREQVDLSRERAWLEAFLPRIRSTLQVLVVPAESIRLSLLTEGTWPYLRELVLYGARPSVDVSPLLIFDMMPNLRSFSLTSALRHGQAPLVIWPESAKGNPDISQLRRFTLSSPSANDRIFAHLPAELEELSLRDSPRFYEFSRHDNPINGLDGLYSPSVLKCGEALLILGTLSCAALVHLELVVIEDDRELDLLAYIAHACPRLEFFEFHCYRDVSEYEDLRSTPLLVPLDSLARALSMFSALRDVRLNIDTPWNQYTLSQYYWDTIYRDGAEMCSPTALIIAQAVPWLHTVSILTRDNSRLAVWTSWSVKNRAGVVDVERLEVTGPGDDYKTIDY